MKDKLFELTINKDDESGVFALSFVDKPAIESNFIYFNELKKVEFLNEEKRIITGAALIPNLPIKRLNGNGGTYEVFLSEKTIEDVSIKFFKKGFQNNTTLQHQIPLDKNIIFESWLIKDKEKDKSTALGIDVPVGTWMISAKIENNELWEKVKKGEVKGFSIEGIFEQIPKTEFKKQNITMNKKTNLFKKFFNTFLQMFMQAALEDGTAINIDEETGIVSKMNEDGTLEPLTEGEYTLMDGSIIKIDSESKIISAESTEEAPASEEPTTEEAPAESTEAEPAAETTYTLEDGTEIKSDASGKIDLPDGEYKLSDGKVLIVEAGLVKEVKESTEMKTENMSAVEIELASYKSQVAELIEKLEKEKTEKKKLKDKIKDLEKEPAAQPIAVETSNVSDKQLSFAEQIAENVKRFKK